MWTRPHAAHGAREAARLFAKTLGELETRGATDVVPGAAGPAGCRCTADDGTGATAAPPRVEVPAALRELDIASACAEDYDASADSTETALQVRHQR